MPIDWDKTGQTFERHPKLSLKKGDKARVTFLDDGNEVSASLIKGDFPRDSFVFVVELKESATGVQDKAKIELSAGDKAEFWISTKSFSLLKAMKELRKKKGTLEGVTTTINRVSDKTTETNYEFA
jgi:hypothetical protein